MRTLAVFLLVGMMAACQFDTGGALGTGSGDGGTISRDSGTFADASSSLDGSSSNADASSSADGAAADAGGTDGGGTTAFRKKITIASGTVSEALTDLPVLVSLVDTDLRDRASSSGDDIFFTKADGVSPLDHEIERWESATGTLIAWVRVPSISDAADTVFYLRYGDAAAAAAQDPAGVWQNGFETVFHMDEDPAAGVVDSVTSNTGQADSSMSSTDQVAAVIGGGIAFDGNDDEITFTNPLLGASPHTISAWVNQAATSDNDALVVLGNGSCNKARWLHSRYNDGNLAAGFYCDDWPDSSEVLVGQGFELVHWVYNSNDESRFYINGLFADGPHNHSGNQSTTGTTGRIGNAPGSFGSNMGINATVDEVRISSVARSAGWIAAEFANQDAPSDFYTVGAEELVP